MRNKKECIAMLLAGGQGSRLGALTKHTAKPAVSFGGKYRIIDFTLSNCANSHIDTVGVLTQYRPYSLNNYIGTGSAWDLDSLSGGVSILPPYATETGGKWYSGTADAIYRNLDFIDIYKPEHVLILSGDHLYRMDYQEMLSYHTEHNADLTVSVMKVPWEDASRFGIITTDDQGKIKKFTEKPKNPDSDLASMGIYIFKTSVLKKALIEDSKDEKSKHDFGMNIIPKLLDEGKSLYSYEFSGFWKDVGTIDSYHEMNMELLDEDSEFSLYSKEAPIMTHENAAPPQFIGKGAEVVNCAVCNGAKIYGKAVHSVIGIDCVLEEGSFVKDSVLLPGSKVGKGSRVVRAILGEGACVEDGAVFGSDDKNEPIEVAGDRAVIKNGGE